MQYLKLFLALLMLNTFLYAAGKAPTDKGGGSSKPSQKNKAPIANAGPDQNVDTGIPVTLDGSQSSDANSDTLTYSWSITSKPGESSPTLSGENTVNPTFTADKGGAYEITLIVNDGKLNSAPDRVIINATTSDSGSNTAPVANAGADQNVKTGVTVTLDGSHSSDVDSDPLTYSWNITSRPSESSAALSSETTVKPTFIADKDGSYVFRLVVKDGTVESAADSVTINATTTNSTPTGAYTLLAWNDLGMHCMDGSDFSVFTILPPYNNLNAHLIQKTGTSDKHITTGVTLTYESYNHNGHVNTVSDTKTNFWDYLPSLFPGAESVANIGLTGNATPSHTPQNMKYNPDFNWFEATGIPIVNRDDDNTTNYYPMVRVVAKDTAGITLATADVVLPVSDEMDCKKCHESGASTDDAKPTAGWENNTDPVKDFKLNILKLHDQEHPINASDLSAVNAKGYNYQASLLDTAKSGTPILCASCHSSNALGTSSVGNAQPLTISIHAKHASVIDPISGAQLNDSANRTACYSCHPGSSTECLRGAMGDAKDASGNQMMQCQSCHGTMSDVGNTGRGQGWQDEPNCQACHQDGQRYDSALVDGSLRAALDGRFATNPNTPAAGVSLYRFSTGHGDLQCSSCHGSTHAIFPTGHVEDNLQSINVQGHSGTIAECTSCHTTMPTTTNKGPHGMHTVGQSWVSDHEHAAEGNTAQCATCHGADYRGSFLSKTFSARTLTIEGKTKTYTKGQMVSCYDCHDGPNVH
jgi:hypothetical protein